MIASIRNRFTTHEFNFLIPTSPRVASFLGFTQRCHSVWPDGLMILSNFGHLHLRNCPKKFKILPNTKIY